MADDEARVLIPTDHVIEGDRDATTDFAFVRVGASVPLKPSDSVFDLQNPPSQPIAVSERNHVLFLAHSQGFFVAKTEDVVGLAKEIKEKGKGPSVEDVRVVDVKVGRVSILAVSTDESTLAAAVDDTIFFFCLVSLLKKEEEPLFSCSLDDLGIAKDFKWQKNMDKSFVVLSSQGTLYYGIIEAKLKNVMDNVDAVDWSADGAFVAVARKYNISILSSNFVELSLSLFFESWPAMDSEYTTKVDSVKWLRDDSIIIGCLQVNSEGDEEGYLVQVIKSKEHKFSVPCIPVVYSFPDLFDGVWDILPMGYGPYLLATYLDCWEVVLASNQKVIDQHFSLFKWSMEDNRREVVSLEFCSDKYTPKIEVPENGDDNLVLGFCVEKVFTNEKITIKVDEKSKELSPRCTLFCLTSERKLNLFHAARISEPTNLPQTSVPLDNNDVVKEKNITLSSYDGSTIKPILKNVVESATSENLLKQINAEALKSQKDTFQLPRDTPAAMHATTNDVEHGEERTKSNSISSEFQSSNQLFSSDDSNIEPGLLISSSSKSTKSNGQTSSLPSMVDVELAPTVRGSHLLAQDGSLPGKLHSGAQPLLENIIASKFSQNLDSEPEFSKQLYNVRNLAKELDVLLSFIEEIGGFRDACTVFQTSSFFALENVLEDLSATSHRCWEDIDNGLMEIQQLQNKMLQVSARQGYMNVIVEQATNKKYWDIWNQQKLNPELEAKRQNILNTNQNLTNKIIELERHFNDLEINRFGESGRTSLRSPIFQSGLVPARQKQSLQSVYNTLNSQLAAAEHLSESLSKQMSELNLNSAPVKWQSIAKELFESIGLSDEITSFQSPVCKRSSLAPDSIRRMPPSSTIAIKKHPRKKTPSVAKVLEPKMARRRRASLDRMVAFSIQQTSNATCVSSSSQCLLNDGMQNSHSKLLMEAQSNSGSGHSLSSSSTLFSQSQRSSSTTSALLSTASLSPTVADQPPPVTSAAVDSLNLDKVSSKPQLATTQSASREVETVSENENKLLPTNSTSSPLPVLLSQPGTPSLTTPLSTTMEKSERLDVSLSQEYEMEEEAPDTTTLSLGSLGGFGLVSTSSVSVPKPNPFGGSFLTANTSTPSPPVTLTAPAGEPLRLASFSLPSVQPVGTSQLGSLGGFSSSSGGGFSGFGQPAQMGVGQQALGPVLGTFGQSRQLGSGMPGIGFASSSSFSGGGFSLAANTGGFAVTPSGSAGAAAGGGFTSVASIGGGFASAAKGGGFLAVAYGGGFAGATSGGGFSAVAPPSVGFGTTATAGGSFAGTGTGAGFASGGFGAFGSNQGGGFSAFSGSNTAGAGKPQAQLFTQMRK